jgi:hypothetical protein
MSEITYSPKDDFEDGIGRQRRSQADFTYSIFANVISIVDLNLGNRSVTNDVENVLRKIEYYHQGSIAGFDIIRTECGLGSVGIVGTHPFFPCWKPKRDKRGRGF